MGTENKRVVGKVAKAAVHSKEMVLVVGSSHCVCMFGASFWLKDAVLCGLACFGKCLAGDKRRAGYFAYFLILDVMLVYLTVYIWHVMC